MKLTATPLTRRRALAYSGAGLVALAAMTAPARANDEAETYVAAILEEANAFSDEDEPTRFAKIEILVDRHVDMRRVGRFVLGQYARRMTPAQETQYQPLFRRYATQVYQKVLSEYGGQKLEVTDSVVRSPRDIIVNSRIKDARPGERFAEVTFSWRVYVSRDGEMSVFDAAADGVWLAIEQRGQFTSIIANNGGGEAGVEALLADLREKVGA
ncbi:MAG: ABC transporter substrate-binding protein [Pseudomonadota bacterium]